MKLAESKEQRLGNEIFEKVGGTENVEKLINCMTRVRMTIRDYDKVDIEEIKAIDGVLGVVEDDTLQVIVGPGTASKVANSMVEKVGVRLGEPFPVEASKSTEDGKISDRERVESIAAEVKAETKAKHNKNSGFKRVLKTIASIFIPLIPAFVGAGIIGGIASVLSNLLRAGSRSWQRSILLKMGCMRI